MSSFTLTHSEVEAFNKKRFVVFWKFPKISTNFQKITTQKNALKPCTIRLEDVSKKF